MQINKKLFTATITTLLFLSILATITPAFAVPTAALSASTGAVGTRITVAGTGAQPGAPIDIFWENTGGLLLASNFADGVGAYNISVTIPDAAAGTHFVIVRDPTGTVGAQFVVTPSISLSPTRGIPGDSVNVTGSGFSGNSSSTQRNVTILFYNTTGTTIFSRNVGGVNASSTGNFSILITVPAVDYGTYTVNATDQATGTPNTAIATFTVAASILINGGTSVSAASGAVIAITGRGFTHTAGLNVSVSLGATSPTLAAEPTQIVTLADGTFSGSFIVPTLTNGVRYQVDAKDPNFTATITASASPASGLRITGSTGITVSPTSGQPGSTVTLTGQNFTNIAGTTVIIRFGTTAAGTLQIATFTTSATGGFSGPITVPTLPTQAGYFINATDTNRLNTTTTFAIAITALFLSPTNGPTGSVISLTGFGLGATGGTTFNVTIGGFPVIPTSNTVASLSAGTALISVPTMPAGTYAVVVTDDIGLSASASFIVTATSRLIVNPTTGPVDLNNVALTLSNFGAGATVSFYIANASNTFTLTVAPGTGFTTLTTNASGMLTGTFTVPALSLGAYNIIANETTGNWNATAIFTIGEATLTVNTRATTYLQGAIVSYNIASSFAGNVQINVYDPAGLPTTLIYPTAAFVPMGTLYVIPYTYPSSPPITAYTLGLQLPSDAPTGTWTWNTTFQGLVRSGNFVIIAAGATSNVTNTDINRTLTTIITTLNGIGSNVTAIRGTLVSIQNDTATIRTDTGVIRVSVTAINASLLSISNGFATVQTSVGTMTTTVQSLSSTLSSISGTVGTISTSVGSLSTDLSAINTKVTSIQGSIATIQTDLGTLQGTVTSTDGKVATIQTDIGTLQADVSAVKTDVNNVPGQVNIPIWIAVVLALVAALAAIASLLLVRRKIAG